MNNEDKIAEAAGFLIMELGIDTNDEKQNRVLARAMEYADIYSYISIPENFKESVQRDIFFTKAKCYFKRTMLNPFADHDQIRKIKDYEHSEISNLIRLNK